MKFIDPIQSHKGRDSFLEMNKRLMSRVGELRFDVHEVTTDPVNIYIVWTMYVILMKNAKPVLVDGITYCRLRERRWYPGREFGHPDTRYAASANPVHGPPLGQRHLRPRVRQPYIGRAGIVDLRVVEPSSQASPDFAITPGCEFRTQRSAGRA